jgi:hypothetical protein
MIRNLAMVFVLVLSLVVTGMWQHDAFAQPGDNQPSAEAQSPRIRGPR